MSQDVKKMCLSRYYRAVLTIPFFVFTSHAIENQLDCESSAVKLLQLVFQKTDWKYIYCCFVLFCFAKSFWPGSPFLIKSRIVWWPIYFSKIATFPFPLSFFFFSFFSSGWGGGRGHTALETCRTRGLYLSWYRVCIFGSLVFRFNWDRPVLFWFYIQYIRTVSPAY